jgi:hypothetical protein
MNLLRPHAGIAITVFTGEVVNRVFRETYSNTSSPRPIPCFQYDISAISCAGGNPIGKLTNAWTRRGSSGSCTTAVMAIRVYIRLESLSYGPMGHVATMQQTECIGHVCSASMPRSLNREHDKVWTQTALINFVGTSGRSPVLNNHFDGAERLCLTTSGWSKNGLLKLFQTNLSRSAPSCTSFDALQNWYLGGFSFSSVSTSCSTTPSSKINVTKTNTNRLRVNGLSVTGQIP